MSLNIKDEEAHRLAREIGELTGQSMTTVVKEALREKLHRVKEEAGPPLSERLMAIGRRCADELSGVSLMRIEDLYDEETGLPK